MVYELGAGPVLIGMYRSIHTIFCVYVQNSDL